MIIFRILKYHNYNDAYNMLGTSGVQGDTWLSEERLLIRVSVLLGMHDAKHGSSGATQTKHYAYREVY